MILTAGLGTRLKPLTNKIPKPLIPVAGRPMLDYAVEFLLKHGVNEIVINVHHLADQLMEYVMEKRWQGIKMDISDETNELLNTGGGLKHASWFFNGETDFVLMASDVLTDLNLSAMIQQHKDSDSLVTLAVKERETSRDLMFDADGNLAGWKHHSTGETKMVRGKQPLKGLGFSGIHVINSRLFSLLVEEGAFSIIDLYLRLAETEKIKAYNHSDGQWMEFGRLENIEGIEKNPDFIKLVNKLT